MIVSGLLALAAKLPQAPWHSPPTVSKPPGITTKAPAGLAFEGVLGAPAALLTG